MTDVLEDLPGDPTYRELTAFIRALDEDEQAWLVALAWIGRGTLRFEGLDGGAPRSRASSATPVRRNI